MVDANITPEEMIPLTPTVFHILLALIERDLHGYGIMKQVAADTGGKIQMGPGTLYGSIKRMLAADLIKESDERPDPILDDERRRYYRLTGFGHSVLTAEMNRLSSALRVATQRGLLCVSFDGSSAKRDGGSVKELFPTPSTGVL